MVLIFSEALSEHGCAAITHELRLLDARTTRRYLDTHTHTHTSITQIAFYFERVVAEQECILIPFVMALT